MSLSYEKMIMQSGNIIDLTNPKVSQICREDILVGLSNLCRYSGGTIHFYSVAQHLLNCYRLASDVHKYDDIVARHVFLHDTAETYLSDIPTPVKKMLPNYIDIEENILKTIYDYFKIDFPNEEERKIVDLIDQEILAYEIPKLIPNLNSIIPDVTLTDIALDLEYRNPREVRKEFELVLNKLVNK